jgi:hypothetical protein
MDGQFSNAETDKKNQMITENNLLEYNYFLLIYIFLTAHFAIYMGGNIPVTNREHLG